METTKMSNRVDCCVFQHLPFSHKDQSSGGRATPQCPDGEYFEKKLKRTGSLKQLSVAMQLPCCCYAPYLLPYFWSHLPNRYNIVLVCVASWSLFHYITICSYKWQTTCTFFITFFIWILLWGFKIVQMDLFRTTLHQTLLGEIIHG